MVLKRLPCVPIEVPVPLPLESALVIQHLHPVTGLEGVVPYLIVVILLVLQHVLMLVTAYAVSAVPAVEVLPTSVVAIMATLEPHVNERRVQQV